MQIKIQDKYKQNLKTACRLAGFTRAGQGSPVAALNALANGTHRLMPTTGSQGGHEHLDAAIDLIAAKTPMAIEYRSPDGKVEIFKAEYAEICWHERQYYLNIWTADLNKDPDLPHNRCLKFERIVSIEPLKAEWRTQGLDAIEIEFRLYEGLRKAYQAKHGDIANYEMGEETIVRRLVTNTFWFVREIIVYGRDCQVVYPISVKSLVIDRLKSALDRYEKS